MLLTMLDSVNMQNLLDVSVILYSTYLLSPVTEQFLPVIIDNIVPHMEACP